MKLRFSRLPGICKSGKLLQNPSYAYLFTLKTRFNIFSSEIRCVCKQTSSKVKEIWYLEGWINLFMCPKMWSLPLLPSPYTLSSRSTFPIPTRVSKLSSWSFYSRFTIHNRDEFLAVRVDWLPVDCPLISETEADHCDRCMHSLFQAGEFSQVIQADNHQKQQTFSQKNVIHTHTHTHGDRMHEAEAGVRLGLDLNPMASKSCYWQWLSISVHCF